MATAQVQTGSILLHAKDSPGAALPGATVTRQHYFKPNRGASAFNVSVLDLVSNVRTGSNTNEFHFTRRRLQMNANLSYFKDNLIGARHEFRFGADFAHAPTQSDNLRNGDINLFTRNGAPAFVTEYNTPVLSKSTVNTFALFGQDSVSVGRVTINGGLRSQRTNGYLPDQSSPAGTFVGPRTFSASFGLPNGLLGPRIVRFGAVYRF